MLRKDGTCSDNPTNSPWKSFESGIELSGLGGNCTGDLDSLSTNITFFLDIALALLASETNADGEPVGE